MKSSVLDYTKQNGLVFCKNLKDAKNNFEILYINEAIKLDATAVFFRRFFKESEKVPYNSEPSICIFQKEPAFINSKEHIELHAAIWSAAKNEVYIILTNTNISIINARKPAKADVNNVLNIDSLILASSNAVKEFSDMRFSAHLFASGTFWEQKEFENELEERNSPYIYLLDYLMTVRKDFLNKDRLSLNASTTDKLLVICILIKFLEEIKDDKGKHTLRSIYKKNKIDNFSEAIDKKLTLIILNELANEFNGQIFDNFSDLEKEDISKSDLTLLSQFLKANINIKTKQLFFWEQYSFKHLPAEVISAIYENFIQAESVRQNGEQEKGVVYTPIHLVNFLVDEVMPLSKPELFSTNNFKILDPSCGSGVFLVAAYKRLLQWWAINNSTEGVINYPQSKNAQKILEDNIFGIDIKETATLVSIFGLTTALLDKLTPQEIWNNFKFKDLSKKNILHKNFFDWAIAQDQIDKPYDLIIGNPPFNPLHGISKKEAVSPEQLFRFGLNATEIPDNNFALKFFEGGLHFGKKLCMIIPANILLYNKQSQEYRKKIFTKYTFKTIYDFTHLRRDLFHKSADTPVLAVCVENVASVKQPIEHIVIKRMSASEKKVRFEIDYYDRLMVNWNWAVDDRKHFVWKTNLLGGGRLFHFVYRLSLLENLKEFLDKNKSDFIYNFGYKVGGVTKKNPASYITNQDKVDHIDAEGNIISNAKEVLKSFEAPRSEDLYRPPYILIHPKVGDSSYPIAFLEKYSRPYLVFDRRFIGIKLLRNEKKQDLKLIFDRLKYKYSSLYQFWTLANSSSALVKQETTINKDDFDSLPFPEEDEFLKVSKTEKILMNDVLKYYMHLGKSINIQGAGNIFTQSVPEKQLKSFGQVYCDTLNAIYAENKMSWQIGSVIKSPMFVVYQFGFGKNNKLNYKLQNVAEYSLNDILNDSTSNKGAIFSRIIRIYNHETNFDCIYFVKPNALRYWLDSIALRDADETFIDLKKGGF